MVVNRINGFIVGRIPLVGFHLASPLSHAQVPRVAVLSALTANAAPSHPDLLQNRDSAAPRSFISLAVFEKLTACFLFPIRNEIGAFYGIFSDICKTAINW